ncbi:TPA: hypothetical protein RY299_004611 [Enterobacter cloacae]|nr:MULTISPECIES: hypothetical protein [Enterobacterales]HEB0918906.1 hypothetical protein [Enterobacter cloacae]MCI3067276.1 hypothetical protein [Escherichia coli]TBL98070.1 hypothetical protein EYY93_17840 [Hafnia paralvei]HEB0923943.1 hypothetical protein [Enterobacter cloacae]HEB0928843.1 hypothetical protein [Enterobacter cloacae]
MKMDSKFIATEILKQLGGNRFIAMTGAKKFVALENGGLLFALPSNFAKNGINHVKIILDVSDTYTISFYKVRGASIKEIKSFTMIYCDQLQNIFTQITGLNTFL